MARHEDLSQSLSDVLDWIGLSEEEVQWRIKTTKQCDEINRLLSTITCSLMPYRTGSEAEGLGLKILGSDSDVMLCEERVVVISDVSEWKLIPSVTTLLMTTTGVHPGYCRLIIMQDDKPKFLNDEISFLKNTRGSRPTHLNLFDNTKQGPANTLHINKHETDTVHCFQAKWPSCAREWLNRVHSSSYPPVDFVQNSEDTGIHIVPTGYKNSKYKDTEWRLSFALVELNLVRMWPNTLRKCYVLLKLLRKNVLEKAPHLSHTLSSYHLKTVLLWLADEKGFEYWNNSPITECLMCCLDRLLCFATSGCIPHYILRSNNLFDCEAGTSRQEELIVAISIMMSKGPACVMDCNSFRQWKNDMITKTPENESIHVRFECSVVHGVFASDVSHGMDRILIHSRSESELDTVTKLINAIRRLIASNRNHDYDVTMAIKYITDILKTVCGTILLSLTLSHKKQMSNIVSFLIIKLSKQLLTSTMQTKLVQSKLANFYYHTGQYRRAVDILHALTDMNYFIIISFMCSHKVNVHQSSWSTIKSPFDVLFMCTSVSLLFLSPEIHATIPALKYEMFKPQRQPAKINEIYIVEHKCDALVDPIVFVYFLQYLCYCQLMRKKHADVAFDNLQCVVTKSYIQHRETALNILGHCFIERGRLAEAKNCFVKSLQIQSKFSVAPLHLAVLIGKTFTQ